jgi:hypothetical protein
MEETTQPQFNSADTTLTQPLRTNGATTNDAPKSSDIAFSQNPTRCICEGCKQEIISVVQTNIGLAQWMGCLLLFFIGFDCCCCCSAQRCIPKMKDVEVSNNNYYYYTVFVNQFVFSTRVLTVD